MSATLKFDMTDFNQQVEGVRRMLGRNSQKFIRTTARRLVKRLAFAAPKAAGSFAASGRLRAGFWPAAIALGVTNIYTNQPDKNEGSAIDKTTDSDPSFTIINSVPYIASLKSGMAWADEALTRVRMQMVGDLVKHVEKTWERTELIEDLFEE